jgi:hypothetical protein
VADVDEERFLVRDFVVESGGQHRHALVVGDAAPHGSIGQEPSAKLPATTFRANPSSNRQFPAECRGA